MATLNPKHLEKIYLITYLKVFIVVETDILFRVNFLKCIFRPAFHHSVCDTCILYSTLGHLCLGGMFDTCIFVFNVVMPILRESG